MTLKTASCFSRRCRSRDVPALTSNTWIPVLIAAVPWLRVSPLMASESTALIRVEETSQRERNDTILPLPSLTVIRNGPGLSMLQLANYGGKAFESIANYCFDGPKAPKSWIVNYFGDDGERQTALDNLHHHNRKHPSSPAIQKQHKALRIHCHRLLNYARPQSHTIDTQIVTFKMLVAIIPRYPGIRALFHDHKDFRNAPLSHLWKRDQDCGKEWIFYRDLVIFCISEGPLTFLVEGTLPSKLGRLELVAGNLNKVPVEALLAHCRSGPEFDPPRLCAIRYLSGILEVRSFWLQGKDDPTRFYDVLCDIYETILQLIQDTEMDVADGDSPLIPWLTAARDALDLFACAALEGLLLLDHHKCLDSLPRCPPQLPMVVSLIMRDGVQKRFPEASIAASSVNAILERTPPQNTENADDIDRAESPRVQDNSEHSEDGNTSLFEEVTNNPDVDNDSDNGTAVTIYERYGYESLQTPALDGPRVRRMPYLANLLSALRR
ncbi:hypothetical protein FB451DRAFT_1260509 [Mycena latifolia]|nr:hypothetical protein FB451DRAFT_1260509 [Mycena latifolia]